MAKTLLAEEGKKALIQAYMENITPINNALIKKARMGDVTAIKELHDRVHGKSLQSVELSGKNGVPLFDEITKTKSKKAISEFAGADVGQRGSKRD